LNNLGTLLANDTFNLRNQTGFDETAVQPPAHHRHKQHQERRETENSVERHRRAHAHAVGCIPLVDGPPQGTVDFLER